MLKFTTAAVVACTSSLALAMDPKKDDVRQFQEIVFENGYKLEHYTLITEDNYALTLYRIPGKFAEGQTNDVKKPAVFMMHS